MREPDPDQYKELSAGTQDDVDAWQGHPGLPVSAEELSELIAQDYRGGKFSWR